MPELHIRYRCSGQHRPHFLRNSDVAQTANEVRRQLVSAKTDLLPLSALREISALNVNGVAFDLWVDLDHPVTDETGQTVLGVCEFDPGAGHDAALLCVSPAGENMSEELALSTFGHELGHAVFEAPGWIVASKAGPGLFAGLDAAPAKAYRTITRNAEHLNALDTTGTSKRKRPLTTSRRSEREKELQIAEFRSNEFMGSLLVPCDRLVNAARELASDCGVKIEWPASLCDDASGIPKLSARGALGSVGMQNLQREIAKRFGVHRRFIEVRMERYGLLQS